MLALLGFAIAIIGVGVRLIVAFKPPESEQAKSILGNLGYVLFGIGTVIVAVVGWIAYVPVGFQSPVKWRLLSNGQQAQQATPLPIVSSPVVNHLGTTLSLQLAQTLDRLPKPCNIKVTPQSNSGDLPSLISWVVSYGNPSGGAICSLTGGDSEPPDADAPTAVTPTSESGMVVHWDPKFVEAQAIVHFFDSSGVKVSISHRIPPNAPANFIWNDIGPGPPWK
jgi:hypothetical protein